MLQIKTSSSAIKFSGAKHLLMQYSAQISTDISHALLTLTENLAQRWTTISSYKEWRRKPQALNRIFSKELRRITAAAASSSSPFPFVRTILHCHVVWVKRIFSHQRIIFSLHTCIIDVAVESDHFEGEVIAVSFCILSAHWNCIVYPFRIVF